MSGRWVLRLTRVSSILEPALIAGSKSRMGFCCEWPVELKLALRFRSRISPLRRGFLVFGAWCAAGVGRKRSGMVDVPPGACVVPSVAGSGGLSAQTRWSPRTRGHAGGYRPAATPG